MKKVRNIFLLDIVNNIKHIDFIIPSPRSMSSTKMWCLRKKKHGMGALISWLKRALLHLTEKMKKMNRQYIEDS